MNIRHRLQQLDKRNIQKICSQMGIKSSGNGNKSQLITRLLLPLQTYKMERTRSNTGTGKQKTIVRPPEYYKKQRMKELAERLQKLNIDKSVKKQPYKPTKEQQRRILELMKK